MAKKLVLLVNVGSPSSTSVKDVRKYLRQFLMDERVIDIPKWKRSLLVKGIIVPFRAPKSAAKYERIWTAEGSPLITITRKFAALLTEAVGMPVYWAMRYGEPAIENQLQAMHRDHPDVEEVVLFPMFPHYATSSYETAVEEVKRLHSKHAYSSEVRVVAPYFEHNGYLEAQAAVIRPLLASNPDHVLFSYHGIPERHVLKQDRCATCLQSPDCCETPSATHATCYRHQVRSTTFALAKLLGLAPDRYSISFQSRLGRSQWLQPDTASVIPYLAEQGARKLLVVCPAFVADCLETLEEIHLEGKELFLEAGGEHFAVVPCMNLAPEWVAAAGGIVGGV